MKNSLKSSKTARIIRDCQFINETLGNGEFPQVLYNLGDTLTNPEYKNLIPMVKDIIIPEAWDMIKDGLEKPAFKLSTACAWVADNTANNPLWQDKEFSKQVVNNFHTVVLKAIDDVDVEKSKQYQPHIVSLFNSLSNIFKMMEEEIANKK